MSVQNPRELFVRMLSDVRRHEERVAHSLREIGERAEDPEIRQSLTALTYLSDRTLGTLDQCFGMISEKPVETDDRLQDVFIDNFRRALDELDSPVARTLYIASKANQLMYLRAGEYGALIAMSRISGNPGVALLLESCLTDKLAFVERMRYRIREIAEREYA